MRRAIIVLFSVSMFLSPAFAGTQTGQVTQILVRAQDGLIYFQMSGPVTAPRPACAQNTSYWMIRDENSNAGKQQLGLLLAARATGQSITVTGSNTCLRWVDGEDVNYFVY